MRTDPSVFNLPVEKLRNGYYSDAYFNSTKAIMDEMENPPSVLMQVFRKKHGVLAGIDEAIAILKLCSGRMVAPPVAADDPYREYLTDTYSRWKDGWNELAVYALEEGDEISPHEPVMQIIGPYNLFAHLETVYLGTLARRTKIATNVLEVCKVANGKPIYYFPARHDHWQVQTGDGFAAHHAGVVGVSTDAQANWWGGKGMGTVPHALIAACDGSTVRAALKFSRKYGEEMNVSVLVDYENDCARTAVQVAEALTDANLPLWGVRLDTSESMVDKGIVDRMGQFKPTGVNPELIRHVRRELNCAGYHDVKIIASGGFNAEKIKRFEEGDVPVDAYGVGASLLGGDFAYTADIVMVNGEAESKAGRQYISNPRLNLVD